MFQGDTHIQGGLDQERKAPDSQSSSLGPEARSILRSIQTENVKLLQSAQLSKSDLHYFRARFNYYRLSLMRLVSDERGLLEPALGEFRANIVVREAGVESGQKYEVKSTPFLAPVEAAMASPSVESVPAKPQAPSLPKVEAVIESPPKVSRGTSPGQGLEELRRDLRLLQLALRSATSVEENQILSDSVGSILRRIDRFCTDFDT